MAKKFVSVNIDNKSIYGVETNNGVIELSKKFPENSIVRMLSGIRSLNKSEYLSHIKSFFSDGEKVRQGKLQLEQHLEKLEINVNFRESL